MIRKIFTFYINDVLLFKCPIPGPKFKSATDKTGLETKNQMEKKKRL